jgi:acetylornithine deacetylase
MQMAIAEKGLIVLDCTASGKAGHAAREEGINAIYQALEDIQFIKEYQFPRASELLGPVKMTVTQINAGQQHNVVPASCQFVVDVRTNEHYSNQDVVAFLQQHLKSEIMPRSLRLNSSGIPVDHPIVLKGTKMGLTHYGSPTLSDQALMPFTSIKIGPGKSSRSHTADEFILLSEIRDGIDTYINLLTDIRL